MVLLYENDITVSFYSQVVTEMSLMLPPEVILVLLLLCYMVVVQYYLLVKLTGVFWWMILLSHCILVISGLTVSCLNIIISVLYFTGVSGGFFTDVVLVTSWFTLYKVVPLNVLLMWHSLLTPRSGSIDYTRSISSINWLFGARKVCWR
jgi:hypothetical protein